MCKRSGHNSIKPSPSRSILREAGKSLRSVLEGVAGGMLTPAITTAASSLWSAFGLMGRKERALGAGGQLVRALDQPPSSSAQRRSEPRLLPFCGACRVRPHLRAGGRPLNLYMYTTNAITAATPYVSARAATTAPTLPHGTALQNTISSQTSDGVTVISSRGRLLVEERGTAA
jgi:hypothetical protein